ncbi:MAG TPA: PEP-CTERM sorting domain-containing protein [Tepidisphaeraceae bacterium]|jgi:hypothetical protein
MKKAYCAFSLLIAAVSAMPAFGQLSKVDTLLQHYGYQLQADIDTGSPYYYNGHINGATGQYVPGVVQANYTVPNYAGTAIFEDSNYPISSELNVPWAIWNVDVGNLPDQVSADVPHLNNLVSMAIGDEQYWESNPTVFSQVVSEFQYVNADPNYNNTIVYTNNFIGQNQLNGTTVSSFIQQAHPDALTFDWYPFTTSNAGASDDSQILNTPFDSWYTEMRFYRDVTLDNSYQASDPTYSVEWGEYRQTYVTDDGTRTPGPTEYAVETFTAMAFNAKMQMDFWYNGGDSQLYTNGNQDAITPFYTAVQHVNQEAANIGRSMVYLTPLIANPNLDWSTGTPDILFLRGQQLSTGTPSSFTKNYNTLPNGFVVDGTGAATQAYSKWTYQANDKYLTGWGVSNIGNTVNYDPNQGIYLPGDVLVSWFRPLGESQTTAYNSNDIYFMVVNALATPTGTAQQCEQYIHLDFAIPNAASQLVQYIDPITGAVDTIGVTAGTAPTSDPTGALLDTIEATVVSGRLRVNLYLGGGEAMLFKIDNGSLFLVPEPATISLFGLAALATLRRSRPNR